MAREREPDRGLRRIEEQSEKILGPRPPETPAEDAIETLGRRIARVLGWVLAAGLVYYLWAHVLGR